MHWKLPRNDRGVCHDIPGISHHHRHQHQWMFREGGCRRFDYDCDGASAWGRDASVADKLGPCLVPGQVAFWGRAQPDPGNLTPIPFPLKEGEQEKILFLLPLREVPGCPSFFGSPFLQREGGQGLVHFATTAVDPAGSNSCWALLYATSVSDSLISSIIASARSSGRSLLSEIESKRIINALGLPVTVPEVAASADAAASAAK